MTIPRENALAFYPEGASAGNVRLLPLTLGGAVRIARLGVDLGRRVPRESLLAVAYELWERRAKKSYADFLRFVRCRHDELCNAVEEVLNAAFETYVKPFEDGKKNQCLTPHGLGWPLEFAEFVAAEYGIPFSEAIETPVARVFALYAACRQRNGGRHSIGADYIEKAYVNELKHKGAAARAARGPYQEG